MSVNPVQHPDPQAYRLKPWQQALLILGLLWALVVIVPDFYRLQGRLATLGFSADNDGIIYRVDGPPATNVTIPGRSDRHLRPDDAIDLSAAPCWLPTSKDCRDFLGVFGGMGGLGYVQPGTKVHLPFLLKDGDSVQARTLELDASVEEPEDKTKDDLVKFFLAFDEIIAVLVLARAFSLVWTRPSRMTLGFFLFVMWFNPGQYFAFYSLLQPHPLLLLIQESLQALAQGAGYAGFLIFALRFPKNQTEPEFQPLERIALYVGAALILLQLGSFLNVFGVNTEWITRVAMLSGYVVAFFAFYIVGRRRSLQNPLDYQRFRWVLWGCIIGIPAFVFADSNEATSLWVKYVWPVDWRPEEWVLEIGFLMSGALTFLICEAVRRQRIISISYKFRGWTAGTFVLILVTAIELKTHAGMELKFNQAQLPELAQFPIFVMIALCGGWAGHKGAHVADHWLNRQLYHASTELRDEGASSKHCNTVEEVDAILANEPLKPFDLTSAAVFRKEQPDQFVRTAIAAGWPKNTRTSLISVMDKQSLENVAKGHHARLALPPRKEQSAEADLTAPAVAVPVMIADEVYAIALYGPHVTGDDLDPLEVKALEEFAREIGDGYETARVKTLERENEELRKQVGHQTPKPS
jgi:hypothetical protein